MRVGVYVDGYNLYYGGRSLCGRSTSGWRWLDLRRMSHDIIAARSGWDSSDLQLRVVYCTARVKGADNIGAQHDQDVYLRALTASGAIDTIEYGTYVSRVATAPLAVTGPRGKPRLVTSNWPIMVKDASDAAVPDARFMASIARREEKGSDVNVAAHLLVDVVQRGVDSALVISNDSDLKLPIQIARQHVPIGLVNPTHGYPAGALNADPTTGAGGHWWYQLTADDFTQHQLPAPLGNLRKPAGW